MPGQFDGWTPSLGCEEEFTVVSLETFAAVSVPDEAMARICRELGPQAVPEYKSSQIECVSQVHRSIEELRDDLGACRYVANAILADYGLGLLGAGMHPFSHWQDMPARKGERYEWIEHRLGDRINQLTASGLHIHVGTFLDGDTRIRRLFEYRGLVPLMIAVSASSPFANGRATGSKSSRRDTLLNLGALIVPYFSSEAEWRVDQERQKSSGHIRGEQDVWNDIRPGTAGKKTVEVRVCDVTPDLDLAAALAALAQAWEFALRTDLVRVEMLQSELDYVREDRMAREAAKNGLDAVISSGGEGSSRLRDRAKALCELLEPAVRELGSRVWIEKLLSVVEAGSAADAMQAMAGIDPSAARCGVPEPELLAGVARWTVQQTARGPACCWPPAAMSHHLKAA